jgi:micrococcal nuclease
MTKSVKNILVTSIYILAFIFLIFKASVNNIYNLIFLTIFLFTVIPFTQKKIYKLMKIKFIGSKVLISLTFLLLTIYSSPFKSTFLKSESQNVISPTIVPVKSITNNELFKVSRVIDGDTIEVTKDNIKFTIRLIGVDTPELLDPRKIVECFAKEASDKTKSALTDKDVYLESDPTQGDKDKYNRLLRYVILLDKTNFNKQLLLEGFAHEYTYNLPYKYQSEFKDAENIARITKKGLWHQNACLTISPTVTPALQIDKNFSCNIKKQSCSEMGSCEEAVFYLKTCKISRIDGNNDGIPCENICR